MTRRCPPPTSIPRFKSGCRLCAHLTTAAIRSIVTTIHPTLKLHGVPQTPGPGTTQQPALSAVRFCTTLAKAWDAPGQCHLHIIAQAPRLGIRHDELPDPCVELQCTRRVHALPGEAVARVPGSDIVIHGLAELHWGCGRTPFRVE